MKFSSLFLGPASFAFIAALAPLTGSAGCGGSTKDTPEAACNDYGNAVCGQLAQCDPVNMQIEYAGSVSACVAGYVPLCQSALQIPGTGVSAAWLQGCSQALAGQSCAQSTTKSPDACALPPGTLADGQPCENDDQCKGGTCTFTEPGFGADAGTGSSCGTCGETKPSGTACAQATDCPGDELCAFAIGGTAAEETSSCVTPGAAGATCSPSLLCQGTLVCSGGQGGTGVCTEPPGVGQPCVLNYEEGCAPGLVCDSDRCQTPTYVPIGGSCSLGNQVCAGGSCVGGTCLAFTADGSPCGTATDADCGPFSQCTSGKCVSSVTSECGG